MIISIVQQKAIQLESDICRPRPIKVQGNYHKIQVTTTKTVLGPEELSNRASTFKIAILQEKQT